ncbi:MAG: DNA primase [Gemmatimonadota bacterium]|nr:DNA primase [Gemmatimonadota bacterium]
MAGRISEELINTIRSQADIVDLVSDFVTLKKSGKNYQGLCPFHNEKTPSFNVNSERQIFHCFGCGKGGNVFTFLMEHEKVTFVEAVQHIADKVHITIPKTSRDQQESSESENLGRVTQFAAKFFHDQLLASNPSSQVRQYVSRRGLSDATVHAFTLGYAPNGWDGLLKEAKKRDISPFWLEKAGLAKTNGERFYDAFRNRLIFPIYSVSGRVVGFGGRALTDEDQPKYLNSPESPIYQKSRIVYGLHQTKDAVRRSEKGLVVEGYMDLLSLYQSGIENVAATCGTALTNEHTRLLARYTKNVVMIFDSDSAGSRAALRGLEPLVTTNIWTQVMQLPEGQDPDTFVQTHGKDSFLARINQTNSISEFVAAQFDTSNNEEREEALRTLAGVINKATNPRHRERYLEEAEQRRPIPQSLMAPMLRSHRHVYRDYEKPQTSKQKFEDPERELLRMMLNDVDVTLMVEKQLHPNDFTNPVYGAIVQQRIDALDGDGPSDPASLVDKAPDEETAQVISELIVSEDAGTERERRVWDYILRIKHTQIKREKERLKRRIAEAEQSGDGTIGEAMAEWQQVISREQSLLKAPSPFAVDQI